MSGIKPSFIKPAAICGGVAAVLATLPGTSIGNCFCCAWMLAAAIIACKVHSTSCKAAGIEFGAAQGAVVGLSTGVVAALVGTVVSIILNFVAPGAAERMILGFIEMLPDLPPDAQDTLAKASRDAANPKGFLQLLVGLLTSLIGYGIFGTLGGLLGGVLFKNEGHTPTMSHTPPPPAE